MGMYQRAVTARSKTNGLRWVLSKVASPLDLKLKGTRFAPSTFGVDLPLCFLSTTGRKSGEHRTIPLLYATLATGSHAVVATNFGQKSHPGWALNLEADPNASLEIDEESRDVAARIASSQEAAESWPLFDGLWPGYSKYREIAPRDIKVFILDPTVSSPNGELRADG
jgi:deazaflavin-dependent oxidoreductase (nitroreductase family)